MATKPKCDLGNCDGNIFSVMGAVSKALKRAGQKDKIEEFQSAVTKSASYEDALDVCLSYVDIDTED